MTFTHETFEPTRPRWVIGFPGSVPEDVVRRIREQMADPEDLRPIVLAEGGVMYDARVGPPLNVVEAQELEPLSVPWWPNLLAGHDPESSLAFATMGMLAYTIAAAEAAMRAVDEIMSESVTATGVTVSTWSRK